MKTTPVASPILFGLLLVGAAGCNDHPVKPAEYESVGVGGAKVAIQVNKDVDILFVMDNSGSMGEEQAALAANFERFIAKLEADDVRANYRIGITTTDNGNVACGGTTPEAGRLVFSSCRGRTQEFIFNGAGGMVDATDEACLDICPEEWSNITTLPTAIADGGETKPRPWIENIGGRTNLPEGLTTTQAFQCLGPQGVAGCGFESHLESMYLALKRADTDGEDSQGFIRDKAILAVVHLTDEADCSENKDQGDAFSPLGNRVLWSDPEAGSATSAVCWNAGVECTGDPSNFDECHSVDRDIDGNLIDDPDRAASDAILRPVDRYVSYLQSFEDRKQADPLLNDQEVLVAVIGGVDDSGNATYAMSGTDKFRGDFGIGPGCTSTAGEAVPPVRLAEFADEFSTGEQNMFSICNNDYSIALEQIANAIRTQIKPSCMTECVMDTDPTTPELEPLCTLEQTYRRSDGRVVTEPIPPCATDGSVPDGTDVCFATLTDGLQPDSLDPASREFLSDDMSDDMSKTCAKEGYNLEFDVRRRDGVPAPSGTSVAAQCQLSQSPGIECPGL